MLLRTHVTLFNSESSLPSLKTDFDISFSFLFFKATLCGLQGLCSPPRDQTYTPLLGALSPNC